jgi:hypothetical protein
MKIDINDIEKHLNPQEEDKPSEETCKFLRKLEGDCRVNSHTLLRFNYMKIILLALPCALSFIGLIFLYHFVSLRVRLFFDQLHPSEKHSATHILVQSNSISTICRIKRKHWNDRVVPIFCFQEL